MNTNSTKQLLRKVTRTALYWKVSKAKALLVLLLFSLIPLTAFQEIIGLGPLFLGQVEADSKNNAQAQFDTQSGQPVVQIGEQLQTQQQTQNDPPTVAELIRKYGPNQSEITMTPHMRDDLRQKAVILTFDDNWESQYTFAEPILRDNGFNATFFVYCLGLEQGPGFMTGDQLRELHARGYDIQSHSMTHVDLTKASTQILDLEIAKSKECLQDLVPGLNVTIFATPFATGRDNATVLEAIQDAGYEFARVGYGGSFHPKCDGWYVPGNQTAGCQLYEPGTDKLKLQNRFNIPTADANGIGREHNHELNATQTAFVQEVEEAISYDKNGKLNSLPVLVYHNFTGRVLPPEHMGQSLLAESFAQQMQYLKDNNFKVLSIRDLVFDPLNQTFAVPKLGIQ
jgi:Polysaccharide deacetylase